MICSGQALPADLDTTDDDPGSRAEAQKGALEAFHQQGSLVCCCCGATGRADQMDGIVEQADGQAWQRQISGR